ncbi:SurA N-terminal domain-containing protein [Candidatus Gottesmanbacteria bacterium]|nr:SurA N-terminal domain-containing protein [Candidatus Gottesmanbacteria bacterium]
MPKKKTRRPVSKAKKLVLPHEMIDAKTEGLFPSPALAGRPRARWVWIALVVVGLAGLLWVNKGMVVAAVVNGRPIFRWELNSSLASRFGKQMLESMISERLVTDAAGSLGIRISKQEVDAKMAEIVKSLGGGMSVDDLLKYQGMTKEDFENQIRLQMTVERVLTKDLVITDGDIDNFIATNRATLVATDPAELREEARSAIIGNQANEKLQPWFKELKDKAKILRFL